MRIVFTSDTHSYHRKVVVPGGDVFVHCGDITHKGEWSILRDLNTWLGTLPHTYKVVIAGKREGRIPSYAALAEKCYQEWSKSLPMDEVQELLRGLRGEE